MDLGVKTDDSSAVEKILEYILSIWQESPPIQITLLKGLAFPATEDILPPNLPAT